MSTLDEIRARDRSVINPPLVGGEQDRRYLLALVERYEKALREIDDPLIDCRGEVCRHIARAALESGSAGKSTYGLCSRCGKPLLHGHINACSSRSGQAEPDGSAACEHDWKEIDVYPFRAARCTKCGASKTLASREPNGEGAK